MSNSIINIDPYTFIYKKDMSIQDWLGIRKDGVGGSDVSVIMDVNPWMSAIRLFYEKVGVVEAKNLDANENIFWGRMDEDNVRNVSQFYEIDNPAKYPENYYAGNQINTHLDFPFFIINNKYPWIQANVDGLGWDGVIIDDATNWAVKEIMEGRLVSPDKIVEYKNIQGRSRDRWAGGVPYGYVLQVLTYMVVCSDMNIDLYGEIYSKVDGHELSHHHIEWNNELVNDILFKTRDFYERVKAAKQAISEYNMLDVNELMHVCAEFEPEVDSSEDFSKFYSEKEVLKAEANANSVVGTPELLDMCIKYKEVGIAEAEISGEKQYLSNLIKDWLHKNKTTIAKFPDGGTVKFNRRIYVSI